MIGKRVILLVFLLTSQVNYGMQSEDAIAATIRCAIVKHVTAGLRHHANYQAILNDHLKKLENSPLYRRAQFYLIEYLGQEWSMYVPTK
jgi:acid phosphatase family membrane protein YuiD